MQLEQTAAQQASQLQQAHEMVKWSQMLQACETDREQGTGLVLFAPDQDPTAPPVQQRQDASCQHGGAGSQEFDAGGKRDSAGNVYQVGAGDEARGRHARARVADTDEVPAQFAAGLADSLAISARIQRSLAEILSRSRSSHHSGLPPPRTSSESPEAAKWAASGAVSMTSCPSPRLFVPELQADIETKDRCPRARSWIIYWHVLWCVIELWCFATRNRRPIGAGEANRANPALVSRVCRPVAHFLCIADLPPNMSTVSVAR